MSAATLERETFTTNRTLEFFSEKELQMQIGHGRDWWPIALTKELLDNAFDACEKAGLAPEVIVTVEGDSLAVRDNGPGLPEETLRRSLDYLVRVSDNAYYASPTRGQLGNALKCVWAAPFVASGGENGRVEVITGGVTHEINVTVDRIAQAPRLQHTTGQDGLVKNGTLVKLHWPRIAGYLQNDAISRSYRAPSVFDLCLGYAAFNPHARLMLAPGTREFAPSDPAWKKWRPDEPTSPHWYTTDHLRALIAAYLAREREGGRARTVREFVSEFAGLSGTAKQKAITDQAGLSGAYLRDMVDGDDVSTEKAGRLLGAMQTHARPVKPAALGAIGEAHLRRYLAEQHHVAPDSIRYRKQEGEADGLPFVLEVALGVNTREYAGCGRTLLVGLNWTPALRMPMDHLSQLLGEARVSAQSPLAVVVHLACPRLEYTDRGKTTLAIPPEIREALGKCVPAVTREWKEKMRQADRNDRMHERELEELRRSQKRQEWSIKEAAYQVMEQAYLHASGAGKYPANARQVMYAARPLVLELTGGKCWKQSSYFTQHLLPDFVDENPETTEGWDVVFDARGRLMEPHTDSRTDLGTLAVRAYLRGWRDDVPSKPDAAVSFKCPTAGPANRYRYALFIEKEGFYEQLQAAQIAERFDLAIMSTKGVSVTAARQLVERLSEEGVTILVAHDFDKAGFTILHTLGTDTRRYRFRTLPRLIDIGLRLTDVEEMGLQSEPMEYEGKVDPRINLRECGANEDECAYLVRRQDYSGRWSGERVELNAMTAPEFIAWLGRKLAACGVRKVVPEADALATAYRRAWRAAAIEKAIEAMQEIRDDEIAVPDGLQATLRKRIDGKATAWDVALWALVRQARAGGQPEETR